MPLPPRKLLTVERASPKYPRCTSCRARPSTAPVSLPMSIKRLPHDAVRCDVIQLQLNQLLLMMTVDGTIEFQSTSASTL